MNYLIAYDIIDNKRRKKLSDLLEGYGYRVNYSVFELSLNATTYKNLLARIQEEALFDEKVDSIRIYTVCQNCTQKSLELTQRPDPFAPRSMIN